jgi:hypothetical protein
MAVKKRSSLRVGSLRFTEEEDGKSELGEGIAGFSEM